ncbi:MAG TPA: calcium-translocating P-type ATPase, PMCA-type [Candidatus Methanofastidiosa archaeon]|nr:calcium-translocating P-type ATPase, PMCA-type [Candidatus Methanofastidiosa archaeon]
MEDASKSVKYHAFSPDSALKALDTSINGLGPEEASKRLLSYGPNILEQKGGVSRLSLFISQFKDFLILILVIAAAISFAVGDISDSVLIVVIIIGNALLGFVQEYKAERSIESLKDFLSPKTIVLRDGEKAEIDAKDLVPGDIVVLESGDRVPADSRILNCEDLMADESMLTGESMPVEKTVESVPGDSMLADRRDVVFMGTNIVRGWANVLVVDTGMSTQMGSIARLIDRREETYFQKKLDNLAKFLGKSVIIIAIIVFALGVLDDEPLVDMVLISLSLAVAAIPEGLPAVVTITLSLGVRKMAQLNAIVKRLPAAETLGSCDVICSDKTGTITMNRMTVRKIYHIGGGASIEDVDGRHPNVRSILEVGAQCNTASLEKSIGDPTEIALLESARTKGIEGGCMHLKVLPFDSERKRMSVFCAREQGIRMFTKGATEETLSACDRILDNGEVRELTDDDRSAILSKNDEYSSNALRVLGFAYRDVPDTNAEERDMIFVGMQAMIDPPREGVRESIEQCRKAGIKVIMITGDHAMTAKAIASEVGIYREGDIVLTGRELEAMALGELEAMVEKVSVYARVNPEHKLKIVEALRARGHVISMTGDGVNDAPALKTADIGVAMNSGTDVSKESSDMILLDDNFTTIVTAVEEGRHIFDNISKFVRYLLATNFGEVFTIFLASIVGFPLPLVAVQILWINLLTDGLPALSLAFESKERSIMSMPPHKRKANIVDRPMIANILYIGTLMAVGTLYLYSVAEADKAMTYAFTTLVMFQLFNVFNCRSFKDSVISGGRNLILFGAVLFSFAAQLCVIYISPLSKVFYTVALDLGDWAMILAAASSVIIVEEIRKAVQRSFR